MLSWLILLIVGLTLLIIFGVLLVFIIRLSKGKIVVALDNFNVSPGQMISGNLILKLKKPLAANGLYVGIEGIAKQTQLGRSSNGKGVSRRSSQERVFYFEQPVDARKQYPAGEYKVPFKMKVPGNILQSQGGALGKMMQGVSLALGNFSSVRWFVVSRLDVPGIDLHGKTQINIG